MLVFIKCVCCVFVFVLLVKKEEVVVAPQERRNSGGDLWLNHPCTQERERDRLDLTHVEVQLANRLTSMHSHQPCRFGIFEASSNSKFDTF